MGALKGLKVLELGGIGPVPFAGMILADMGADVIRINAPNGTPIEKINLVVTMRGRRSMVVDVKSDEGRKVILKLISQVDAMMEGFRPGVLERLGLSPEECWKHNPSLVIARMTGWGQDGPLAQRAGHDINYISLAGALHAIGKEDEPPTIPLNLIGDYAGGGWPLAFGVVSGVWEASRSGQGQVIDVAMVDGTALLLTPWMAEMSRGRFNDVRGTNAIDGGSHYYQVYETSDGRYLSLGSMEPQFYARLLQLLGLDVASITSQSDADGWPDNIERFRKIFLQEPLDHWVRLFDGEDVCFSPVLSMTDAPEHPHLKARQTYVEIEGVVQSAPAPRFSRTPGSVGLVPTTGQHTDAVLAEIGYSAEEIFELRGSGAVA